MIGANNPINSTLYDKLAFDLLRDFTAVAGIYRVYQVMVVNPSFPAKTGAEFVAYAKANPGKINFGSAGTGSVAHVSGECSRCWPASTCSTCPIAARRSPSPTCWAARCR